MVFHREIETASAPPISPPISSPDYDFLADQIEQAHPGYRVVSFMTPSSPEAVAEVFLDNDHHEKAHFLHPVTGADLGPVPLHKFLNWLGDLHVNLLTGPTGHIVNGVGAMCLGVMSLTGILLWWPGRKNWRRSLGIHFRAKWKRVNWDLHSAVGFWTLMLLLIWALTGIYFVFPETFHKTIGLLIPMQPPRQTPDAPAQIPGGTFKSTKALIQAAEEATPGAITTWIEMPRDPSKTQVRIIRHEIYEPWAPHHPNVYVNSYTGEVQGVDVSLDAIGDKIQRWFGYLHFGNFGGIPIKILWVVLGLAPSILYITGFLMWWNRSLGKQWRKVQQR